MPETIESRLDVRTTLMGEGGMLLECLTPVCLDVQQRLWAVADSLLKREGITDAVCGMGNVLVLFDPAQWPLKRIQEVLRKAWRIAKPTNMRSRQVDVPVQYGGERGFDLALVAGFAGLSPREAAQLHADAEYLVFAIGSSPGFGYLGGLPATLAIPRRNVPILRAEKGSVCIGGTQTGVTSAAGPTGWHVIGCTGLSLFNANATPPALLAPGDRVRFIVEGIAA